MQSAGNIAGIILIVAGSGPEVEEFGLTVGRKDAEILVSSSGLASKDGFSASR